MSTSIRSARRWRGAAGLGITGALVAGALLSGTGAGAVSGGPASRAIKFDTALSLVQNGWTLPNASNNDAEIVNKNAFRLSNWLGNDGYGVQEQVIAPATRDAGEALSVRTYSYAFTIDSAYKEGGVRVAQPKLSVEAAVGKTGNRAGGHLIFRIPANNKLELTNYTDPSADGGDLDSEWVGHSATVDFDQPLVVLYSVHFKPGATDTVDISVYGTTADGGPNYTDQRASFNGGTFEYYHAGAGNPIQSADSLAFRAVTRAPHYEGDEIQGWESGQEPNAEEKAFLKDKGFVFSNIAYGTDGIAGIAGRAKFAQTLTAFTNFDPEGTTVKYQWYRGNTAIANATKSTYKAVVADIGRKLKVKITLRQGGTTVASDTSEPTPTVGGGLITSSGNPVIQGTARVGVTLSIQKPSYSVSSPTFAYQWFRDGVRISGATASTYTLTAVDRTHKIAVRVTAKKKYYEDFALASAQTSSVNWGILTVSAAPTIKGTAKVGKTLTAGTPGWTPAAGLTKIYYWYAWDGSGTPGDEDLVQVGSSNLLKLNELEKGLKVTVQVRGFRAGFGPGFVTSTQATATATVG